MKIIEQGSLPEKKVYRSTCNYCKTVFEYTQREANVTYDQRDGDFLTVVCPFCKRAVTQSMTSVNYQRR